MNKISILGKIFEKTIVFDMGEGVKAMTPEESKEWHQKYAYYDKEGHLHICCDPVKYDGINKIKPNWD